MKKINIADVIIALVGLGGIVLALSCMLTYSKMNWAMPLGETEIRMEEEMQDSLDALDMFLENS